MTHGLRVGLALIGTLGVQLTVVQWGWAEGAASQLYPSVRMEIQGKQRDCTFIVMASRGMTVPIASPFGAVRGAWPASVFEVTCPEVGQDTRRTFHLQIDYWFSSKSGQRLQEVIRRAPPGSVRVRLPVADVYTSDIVKVQESDFRFEIEVEGKKRELQLEEYDRISAEYAQYRDALERIKQAEVELRQLTSQGVKAESPEIAELRTKIVELGKSATAASPKLLESQSAK